MLFPTADYGIFFLFAFAAAWGLRRSLRARHGFLLVASYFFYAYWDWRFLPLLVGLSLLAALVGRWLQVETRPRAKNALVAVGVALSLSTLGVFKYLSFASVAVWGLLQWLGVSLGPARVPEVALPVGISFFAFHAISLMVDAYRGRIPVKVKVLDALLYVAFFPQLVAGPILRAASFLPQLTVPPDAEGIDAARAFELVVAGLVKKVLIANYLATRLVDPVFDSPRLHSGLEVLLAVYGYAAQIYCDFSGYTDIAIGSALLLGYRFPENFNAPYLADSPQDFWRRWHISLSSWLRDYLFIPLGGSRGSRARTLANLAITMVLGGLWHGAAWTFVLWGALHGAGLAVHRLWTETSLAWVRRLRAGRAFRPVAVFCTFHFVCLGWVLFRAPSVDAAREVFSALTGNWTGGTLLSPALVVALAAGLFGQAVPPRALAAARERLGGLPLAAQGLALAAAILFIEALGPQGVAPFIYFRF